MTPIDQAARRAAELVLDLDCECKECERKIVDAETIIAAEFAPLNNSWRKLAESQVRICREFGSELAEANTLLAEAVGLLERAKMDLEQWETSYDDIAAFLAKHKEQGNG